MRLDRGRFGAGGCRHPPGCPPPTDRTAAFRPTGGPNHPPNEIDGQVAMAAGGAAEQPPRRWQQANANPPGGRTVTFLSAGRTGARRPTAGGCNHPLHVCDGRSDGQIRVVARPADGVPARGRRAAPNHLGRPPTGMAAGLNPTPEVRTLGLHEREQPPEEQQARRQAMGLVPYRQNNYV
jgi:hypothetical protein